MPAGSARRFVELFGGIRENSDLVGIARGACREGYAVIAVKPGLKEPACTLTDRQRTAADRLAANNARAAGARHWEKIEHPCGRVHAITDPAVAERVFKRLVAKNPDLNIGLEVGASRLLVVDADTVAEVDSFRALWAERDGVPGLVNASPTVRSPGVRREGDNWTHKGGGHFWFLLPDGVDFTEAGTSKAMKIGAHEAKASLMFRDQLVLVPPSVREEGPYVMASDICPAPEWMVDDLLVHIAGHALRAESHRDKARSGDDPIEMWAASRNWDEILPRYDWTTSGRIDNCGCEIWTRPGDWSSPKSATAHEPGCLKFDSTGGFLHLWTDKPPAELEGQQSWSKLQLVAAYDYGGNISDAMRALEIDRTAEPTMTADEIFDAATRSMQGKDEGPPADVGPAHGSDDDGDDAVEPEGDQVEEEPESKRWLREQLDLDPALRKRTILELESRLAKESAKRIHRGLAAYENRQHRLEVVSRPVSAAELYARPHVPPNWAVKGLLEVGHHGLLAAPAKGGKTTMLGNLLLAMTSGSVFLDQFPVPVPVGPIEVIDVEMSEGQHTRWLQEMGLRSPEVFFHHIRGQVGTFELLDDTSRGDWAAGLKERGTRFLVIDPLAPLLAAAGLDENNPTDIGAWFAALKELCREAAVDNALVVHHHGHTGERARGSSNLLATPDVLWTIVKHEDETRYFKAIGRDVEVMESALEFDPATRKLSIAEVGKARPSKADSVPDPGNDKAKQDKVMGVIRGNPGINMNGLKDRVAMRAADVPKVVAALEDLGMVRTVKERQTHHLFVSDYQASGDDL